MNLKEFDEHKVDLEYNQIDEYIYLGTNYCCQIHFNEDLLEKGIRADISLEGERIDEPKGVDIFLWLPTIDGTAPTQEKLEIGVACIDKIIKNKIKVYIHCKNGHGRAPTLLAAYYISKGLSVKEAIEKIEKKRPEIHPNEEQIRALEEFGERLKD